jgi:hypothetical protein
MNVDRIESCLAHGGVSNRGYFERGKSSLAPLFQRGERLRGFQTQECLIPPFSKGGRGDLAAVERTLTRSTCGSVSAILLPRRVSHGA